MSDQQALARTVQRLLRPVLRFCLRRSLRLREIVEIMKLSLVEIALDELASHDEPASVSRVSLMTGVHRKDVTVLMSDRAPRTTNDALFRRVIGQWRSDRRFSSAGRPRPLDHVGHRSEFARLVRAVNKELNPYSVLFELARVGAIEERDDKLHLVRSEYIPLGKLDERFALVSQDVDDLVRAAEENILTPQEVPNLHLTTAYDDVVLDELPRIRRWFIDEGAALHERARRFLSAFDRDINPRLAERPGKGRVVIGTFSFVEGPSTEPKGSKNAVKKG
jgi:hypothetical protein